MIYHGGYYCELSLYIYCGHQIDRWDILDRPNHIYVKKNNNMKRIYANRIEIK